MTEHDRKPKVQPVMGLYQAHVKAQCSLNPSLLNLFQFLSNPKPDRHECQIVALDFQEGFERPVSKSINSTNLLYSQLQDRTFGEPNDKERKYHKDHLLQGRIIIIEDLTKEIVEILGSDLDIDPLFFALHLHTAQKEGMSRQSPESATLPSRLISKNYININYHRAITFDTASPSWRLLRDTIVDRKVVVLPSTTIGLAQHCASIIYTKKKTRFWIGTYGISFSVKYISLADII